MTGDYWEDPYPAYEELRARGPLHFDEDLDAWIVTGHEEARAALTDDALSSDWLRGPLFRTVGTGAAEHVRDWLMWLDPPCHGAARTAVASLFGRRMSRERAGWIAELARRRWARFAADGGGDAVAGYAVPLTTTVIIRVAGLTATEATLRAWSSAAGALMARPHHPPTVAAADRALAALAAEIEAADGAGGGEETVVGKAAPEVRGGGRLQLASLFAFAGIETTSQAIARLLDLGLDGALDLARPADAVVSELLRYDTPVPQVPRVAARDTEVAGRHIGAGEAVLVLLAAANRDPGRFPEPGAVGPRSDADRHLAYGHGRHRCVGANLAHQLLTAVVPVLRATAPRRAGRTVWHRDRGYRGIERLDVAF
ncbi:cytochrome P450 [Streptomyces sp. NBRC 109706]|uniref:cytochrome P450 n=1 Tax=Streptomyces sp. NBRC 109706 TaxID=1550035 RepID=UPI000784A605|nr:cytochrome P450 [Streptomyces sp. NBRC 109706]